MPNKYKTKKSTTKKQLKFLKKGRSLILLPLTSLFVLALYTGYLAVTGNLNVNAQSTLPITTFKSTYSAYNPNTAWESWLTPAQQCSETQTIYGAKPTTASATLKYPVLLYIHGTYGDLSGNVEGQQFVQRAAAQGFVAEAITYDSSNTNSTSGYAGHAYCMFNPSRAGNAVAAACAPVGADCSKGVLVTGFSQGAVIATIAKNYNANVAGVWALGLSASILPSNSVPANMIAAPGGTRALPNNDLVINMGETAAWFSTHLNSYDLPSLKQLTGVNCGTSYQCVQNGNGYYVVANSEVADGSADHCYWEGNGGCSLTPTNFEVGFQPPATTQWSMLRNLNWLRSLISA